MAPLWLLPSTTNRSPSSRPPRVIISSLRNEHPARMNRNSELVIVFLALALSAVCAEFVPPQPCPNSDPNAVIRCTVDEVYIDPCKEIAESKPCKLTRGITSNMTIHFTPHFSANTLTGRVFWASQLTDIPFMGMDDNACLSTTCPLKAFERNTFYAEIPILQNYPIRTYDLKWRIWNDQNEGCCFMYKIKISKI